MHVCGRNITSLHRSAGSILATEVDKGVTSLLSACDVIISSGLGWLRYRMCASKLSRLGGTENKAKYLYKAWRTRPEQLEAVLNIAFGLNFHDMIYSRSDLLRSFGCEFLID